MCKEKDSSVKFCKSIAELWLFSIAFFIFMYYIGAGDYSSVVISIIMVSVMSIASVYVRTRDSDGKHDNEIILIRYASSIMCGIVCTRYLLYAGCIEVGNKYDIISLTLYPLVFGFTTYIGTSTFYAVAYIPDELEDEED